MKNVVRYLLFASIALCLPGVAVAAPSFVVNEEETLILDNAFTDDVYAAGGNLTINKQVDGDLIVGGGTVEVTGEVTGDVIVAAGTVILRGKVGDDVRIGGGQVSIYGQVGDDVLVAAGSVTIGSEAQIRGDMIVGTGDLVLNGRIEGNLKAQVNKARIKGLVRGDATMRIEDSLVFNEGARIEGKFSYFARIEDPSYSAYASEVQFSELPAKIDWGQFRLSALVWEFLTLLFIGLLLVWILPKYLHRTALHAKDSIWKAMWYGLIFLLGMPLLALMLFLTIVGWPLGLIVIFGYCVAILLALITGSYVVGYLLIKKDATNLDHVGNLVLGLVALVGLDFVPIVGGLIKLLIVLVGLGAMSQEKLRVIKLYRE